MFTLRAFAATAYLAGAFLAATTLTASAGISVPLPPPSSAVFTERGEFTEAMLSMLDRIRRAPKPVESGESGESEPPRLGSPDPQTPGVGLPGVIARLGTLIKSQTAGTTRTLLVRAHTELGLSLSTLHAGSTDARLGYLPRSAQHITAAQTNLKAALASGGQNPVVLDMQSQLASITRRMARDVIDVARRAGVSSGTLAPANNSFQRAQGALNQLNYALASDWFDDSLGFAADTITFDIELFESNVIAEMSGEAIGWALSITFEGQTYNGGHAEGQARTAADPPATAQSPHKDMHVASVSKTLTTIATLRVLQDLGLTPDEEVAPYLPGDWVLGDGVEDLTFRDFMTHHTGFGQKVGDGHNTYSNLQTVIAQDVGATGWSYANANFGLLRVAVAGLLGIDPVDYPAEEPDVLTAAAFLVLAQALYDSIGVSVDCTATDANPTFLYRLPDAGVTGWEEPDNTLACGGIGWNINANELAGVMATLRYTQQLLSTDMRNEMFDGFLGLMDPQDWSHPTGAFGVYQMHGGDWAKNPAGPNPGGALHTCVVAFPIVVEAALVMNSDRGDIDYQCRLLRDAFDNAWVP
ncbi:MAG TPA: serine hydrolase [Steroidobacteraceae bacterium]|nr:serine hydrolase [Steroidobacteraceae bacterium]